MIEFFYRDLTLPLWGWIVLYVASMLFGRFLNWAIAAIRARRQLRKASA